MKNVEARKDRKDAADATVKAAKKLKNTENKTFRRVSLLYMIATHCSRL